MSDRHLAPHLQDRWPAERNHKYYTSCDHHRYILAVRRFYSFCHHLVVDETNADVVVSFRRLFECGQRLHRLALGMLYVLPEINVHSPPEV